MASKLILLSAALLSVATGVYPAPSSSATQINPKTPGNILIKVTIPVTGCQSVEGSTTGDATILDIVNYCNSILKSRRDAQKKEKVDPTCPVDVDYLTHNDYYVFLDSKISTHCKVADQCKDNEEISFDAETREKAD